VQTIRKRLDMSNDALQSLLREHEQVLRTQGVQFHGATKSEVAEAVQLPSALNPNEPAYIGKLSRPATK
jgi:alkyl sulfatase BDS1-like metallo-beta-lactamase superfamily hydrolase